MSLQDHARREFGNLVCGLPVRQVLSAIDNGLRLRCEVDTLDTLACAFLTLTVESDSLNDAEPKQLQQISESLARRLTYLLEPISPIELDSHKCLVQMRSKPPQKETGQTCYYELLVSRGGAISLSRYAAPQGQPRRGIPAQVTREVLLRLVGDFEAVLA